ncbi:hypothetical protein C8F04DRAFT_1190889 [Mycena alexandri]|uniref:Uncharacterized protein n=1 Tax=Mycena alexandri TaxID=1745969 RepID=A0AAD6SE99_9AGAR|nr:hypothetical protein C8F04DRAFT_1190889 [Mycena alexandri]
MPDSASAPVPAAASASVPTALTTAAKSKEILGVVIVTYGAARNWTPAAPDPSNSIVVPPSELDLRVKHADAFDAMLASALGCLAVSTKIQTERTAHLISLIRASARSTRRQDANDLKHNTYVLPDPSNESLSSARDDRLFTDPEGAAWAKETPAWYENFWSVLILYRRGLCVKNTIIEPNSAPAYTFLFPSRIFTDILFLYLGSSLTWGSCLTTYTRFRPSCLIAVAVAFTNAEVVGSFICGLY